MRAKRYCPHRARGGGGGERGAVLPASIFFVWVEGSDDEMVADCDVDVLRRRGIAVRIRQPEREVEVGGDRPGRRLNEPDVNNFQNVIVGRIESRQGSGGTAAAVGSGGPVEVYGITRQTIGALHDLHALYLVRLASTRVVVLFNNDQGVVVVERELGAIWGGN